MKLSEKLAALEEAEGGDDDIETLVHVGKRLGAALGAVAGVGGRHDDFGAEVFCGGADAVIIGGDHHARVAFHRLCGLPATLDQRLLSARRPAQHGQRLAGVAL